MFQRLRQQPAGPVRTGRGRSYASSILTSWLRLGHLSTKFRDAAVIPGNHDQATKATTSATRDLK